MSNYLVCSPIAEHGIKIEGSIDANCSICTRPVWIAPTGVNRLADISLDLKVMCVPCYQLSRKAQRDQVVLPIADDQRREIESEIESRKA